MKAIKEQFKKEFFIYTNALGVWKKKNAIIGLDIGHDTFRAVRLDKTGNLRQSLSGKLEEIKDLKDVFRIGPFEEIYTNMTIDSLVVSLVDMPLMPREEIKEALKWELKDKYHIDIENLKIRFEILGEKQLSDGSRRLEVLAFLYKESEIEENLSSLKRFDLNLQAVFPSILAIARYVEHMKLIQGKEKIGIVDIGYSKTSIGIAEGEKVFFLRVIGFGGDAFTEAMTTPLASEGGIIRLSREEAERIKCEQGIIGDAKIVSMMRPLLEKLCNEIKRSFEYFGLRHGYPPIKNIILAGNGARLKGLKEYIEVETGLKIIDILPENACSIGLALLRDSRLNIIPETYRDERKGIVKSTSFRIGLIIIALLLGLSYWFLLLRLGYLKDEIKLLRSHMENVKEIRLVKEEMTGYETFIDTVSGETGLFTDTMRELSHIIPLYVTLDGLRIGRDRPNLILSGVVLGREYLSEFMGILENSPLFENVRLNYSKEDSEGDNKLEFEIVCDIIK